MVKRYRQDLNNNNNNQHHHHHNHHNNNVKCFSICSSYHHLNKLKEDECYYSSKHNLCASTGYCRSSKNTNYSDKKLLSKFDSSLL